MPRHRAFVTYLTAHLIAIGTAIRYLVTYQGDPFLGLVIGLLAVFLLLLFVEPQLSRRSRSYVHIYLAIQTAIAAALSLVPPNLDYFSILFVPLTLQAVHVLGPRLGFRWIGLFAGVMAALMLYGQEFGKGLSLVLVFVVLYLFFGSYVTVARQAEAARDRSQELLGELQAAHGQLQLYAAQAEELAVAQERNRLARNLHDSVTQTIFTMTLTTEAARILFARDPACAVPQLGKLQELARSALREMRSLIAELRPTAITEQGLVLAVRRHIAMFGQQHALDVALDVTGEPDLPTKQAERLFRVVQEALNNVAKHAHTDRASVTLRFEDSYTFLVVEDWGVGFSPQDVQVKTGHIGLSTMRERVELMGGTLTIDSRPGEGTCLTVRVPRFVQSD